MLALTLISSVLVASAVSAFDPMKFLSQYGYLKGYGYSADVSYSIMKFQNMAGLTITGKLDAPSIQKMRQPRCGVPDISIRSNGYAFDKWRKNALKYRFLGYTNDLTSAKTREIIRHAFRIWSDIVPLTFSETRGRADFTIDFRVKDHGDNYPFDGQGGTLAHAFFPEDGRIHFDEHENWVDGRSRNGNTNLFYTAAHEIGHAIGLEHVNDNNALMNPYHIDFGNRHGWKIPIVDRINIQKIYGAKGNAATAAPTLIPRTWTVPVVKTSNNCFDYTFRCRATATAEKCRTHDHTRRICKKTCKLC